MHKRIAAATLSFLLALFVPVASFAQLSQKTLTRASLIEAAEQTPAPSSDLKISIYPILLWVPAFTATTVVPPFPDAPNGPDLPGGSGSTDASFDGAYLAGLSIEKGNWRIDTDGIWAALVTTRDRPLLNIDLDILYGHVSGGVKIYKDLYVTGGVRRVALKYDIQLADRPQHFVRKPGIWDPLVGLGWHSALGSRWTLNIVGEGGGFGVGADVDFGGSVRADWKVAKHVGLTFGYGLLYFKLSDTVLQRTFEVKQTLHGPVLGLGLYF